MLHATITELYTAQRSVFKRIITIGFAMAGIFWFLIYGIAFTSADPHVHDTVASLRSGQSLIYFILLMLWGMDYLREQKRLRVIIDLASAKQLPPDRITRSDVEDRLHLFTVFIPRTGSSFSKLIPLINIGGLTISVVLICMQWWKGITFLLQ